MSGGGNLPLAGTPEQQLADPLHLFPGADSAGQPSTGAPSTLPNLGGTSMTPHTYSPTSFTARTPAGPGKYNAMAASLAGPVYNPTLNPVAPTPAAQPQPTVAPQASSGAKGGMLGGNALR